MEESSGKTAILKKSKYFTVVKSSYSLRRTPARSDYKRKPTFNFDKILSPNGSISLNLSNSQVVKAPQTLPRRYPSRVRVSAVHSLSSKCPKEPLVEEESQESESRKKIKETMRGFREIYDKVVEGLKKGPEESSRPDLVAYNIFRVNNKIEDLGNAGKCLGCIPGVEIGDKFDFRVELCLLGLHRLLQANIDYVTKDERLVATSVVSVCSGRYGNNVRISNDVLVCSGSGYTKNDQKMKGGNLALKNSIDDENPIRVIFGIVNGKSIKYVYGGLYLAEKYWNEKGNHGSKVFLFQLRKLDGQAKLDIKEVMKSISPSTGGKDIEGKHLLPSKCTCQKVHPSTHRPAISEYCKLHSMGKRGREEEEDSQAQEERKVDSRKKIKRALYDFLSTYEKLAEEKLAEVDEAKQRKEHKKKKMEPGVTSKFDLDAYRLLKDKYKDLSNASRHVGGSPGVEVGDKFHFRAELALLGLHCHLRADIDFIEKDERLLAVSIVSIHFGKYNGNSFRSDVLLFCGSGLKNENQKMVSRNLALKNSFDAKTPLRVFYGFKKGNAASFYVYYGLYLVEKYWRKKDDNGYYVFMFRLRRLPGQPNLDIEEIKKSGRLLSCSAPKYTEDISRGKEKVPIRVVNTTDEERMLPFEYITEVIRPSNYSLTPLEGCNCINGCSDSDKCACAVRNGGELPFNGNGAIVEAKPLVYECGPSCKCPPSCHNRASQHGIKFSFEVFKTETMGWGVRSRTFIPSGSFICEYVGELLEDEEAQKRTTDEYLFAIGNNYYDESLWEGLASVPCLQKSASHENVEYDGGFTLDSSRYGNVGKFINHSCTPNLYAQNLLNDHDDKRMPRVVFFACEDIPPLQELTYHYNYTIGDVRDSDGNIRKKNCYCGSIECTGRLY